MAKKITKTSERAEFDIEKYRAKWKKKKIKKSNLAKCAVVFLSLGILIGSLLWFFICRNDKFDLVGQDQIVLQLGDIYYDESVSIVAFGKDISSEVVIETDLIQNNSNGFYAQEAGTYYIKYISNNFK